MIFSRIVVFCLLSTFAWSSPLRVIVTIPDFIHLFESIGKQHVQVESFLDGKGDPHFVDANPSFISKAARADVVCSVGLDLEVGWLPKILAKSNNPNIQSGGLGDCDLSKSVKVIEKATSTLDRSMGDVHAHGNPHYYLSLLAMSDAAITATDVLSKLRPEHSTFFLQNLRAYQQELLRVHEQIRLKLLPFVTRNVLQYHKEFSYFFNDYGLKQLSAIEEKPGVPPSSGRLAFVSNEAKSKNVILALASEYSPRSHLKKFHELSGVPVVYLPTSVQSGNSNISTTSNLLLYYADILERQFKENPQGR